MRTRAFNPQLFLEFLCSSAFGGLMLYLVSSGKYLSYVTPRMEPYLCFTAIVMGIWALAGLGGLFRPQHKIRSAHCFVLAIPIILLLLPHSPLSTSGLSGNYTGGTVFAGRSGQNSYGAPQKQAPSRGSGPTAPTAGISTGNPAEGGAEPADNPPAPAVSAPPSEDAAPADSIETSVSDTQADAEEDGGVVNMPGLDVKNRKITVSNADFGLWFSELYAETEKYEGYTVVMTGFVFKDPKTLKQDEFVPARLMMSCCVADLAPVGLLCKYAGASELKAESWVTVEGTLFIGQCEYDGEVYDDPQISVTKITPAEAVEGYVYPY